jgi:hypothetical protein
MWPAFCVGQSSSAPASAEGKEKDDLPLDKVSVLRRDVKEALEIEEAHHRAAKLLSLARQQFAAADREGAESTLAETEKAIGLAENTIERARLYADLATFQAQANKRTDAIRNDRLARKNAEELKENALVHVVVMIRIAFTASELTNEKESLAILETCEKEAAAIKDPLNRSIAWSEIARAWSFFENKDLKKLALSNAVAAAKEAPTPRDASEALCTIAEFQTSEKEIEAATETLTQAQSFIEKISDAISRGHAQLNLAERWVRLGKADEYERNCLEVDDILDRAPFSDLQRDLRNRLKRIRKSYSEKVAK